MDTYLTKFLFAYVFLCMPGNTTQDGVFRYPGQEIVLSPESSAAPITIILWRYHDNKLAEWEKDSETEYFGISKGRTSLDTKTGNLRIRHLTKGDNGPYSVQINDQPTPKKYNLTVIDALDKPNVTCEVNNDSTLTLLCAGDQSPLTQYSWEGPDTQDQTGYKLLIKREESQSSDSIYTCVVKDPVSENREDFTVKSCFPEQDNSAIIGVSVVGVVGVLLVLAIVGYRKRDRLQCQGREDEGTTRSEETHPLTGASPEGDAANSSQPTANDSSVESMREPLGEVPSVEKTGDDVKINIENGTGETAPVTSAKDASRDEEPGKPSHSSPAQGSTENGTEETAPETSPKDASGDEEPSKPSHGSAAQDSTGDAPNSSQPTTVGEPLMANDSDVKSSREPLEEIPSDEETKNGTEETALVTSEKEASGDEEPSKPSHGSAAQGSTAQPLPN